MLHVQTFESRPGLWAWLHFYTTGFPACGHRDRVKVRRAFPILWLFCCVFFETVNQLVGQLTNTWSLPGHMSLNSWHACVSTKNFSRGTNQWIIIIIIYINKWLFSSWIISEPCSHAQILRLSLLMELMTEQLITWRQRPLLAERLI